MREPDEEIQSAVPEPGLSPLELARDLLARIDQGNIYARSRKRRFRERAVAVRVTSVALSGASTIILGLQNLGGWTAVGFSLVALVTVVNGLEPYFAWRSRWVLMEQTRYRFFRLRDDLTYYLAATRPEDLDPERIRAMFEQYQGIWGELSESWLEYRRYSSHDR